MSEQPRVQDVAIWQGKTGAWCWAYRLGNRIVQGTVWCRTGDGQAKASRYLDDHLAERGLSR
jgi:hypothetical protein